MPDSTALSVEHLTKRFPSGAGRRTPVVAVDDVSFTLERGEAAALVGESGSGKTTIGRIIAGVETATAGRVSVSGEGGAAHGRAPKRRVQMVFQDPYASLNPFNSVAYTLSRPLINHQRLGAAEARRQAAEILATVQMTPPEAYLDKRPHELSGGQRQRVGVARALAAGPEIVVADEPVSMLDVSIRAEILSLLARLLEEKRIAAMLYITHDLLSARLLARRIMVLYRGTLVESGGAETVLSDPKHPYTQLLWSAIPNPRRAARGGTVSVPTAGAGDVPPNGCPFAPRCPLAVERCWAVRPTLVPLDAGRSVACHVVAPAEAAV